MKKLILVLALTSLFGCDKINSVLSEPATCANIVPNVISAATGQGTDIVSITGIITSTDLHTVDLQLPGQITLACEGNAFTQSGEKRYIRFYQTVEGQDAYVGLEDITELKHLGLDFESVEAARKAEQ